MGRDKNIPLRILNVLMTTKQPQTVNDLCLKVDAERKSIYRAISVLENLGFNIIVDQGEHNKNLYSFNGIYGMDVE